MSNIILTTVQTMSDCGWHISSVSVVRGAGGEWHCEINVQDNVPDGWTWDSVGGQSASRSHVIQSPPQGPLVGIAGVTVESWINRPPAYILALPPESIDIYEQWIAETARVGKSPDYAWLANHTHLLTKPIEWMAEPLRSGLLRKQKT